MDDARVMCRAEPGSDLHREVEQASCREGTAVDFVAQPTAIQQFRDDEGRARTDADIVNSQDVRMIEAAGGTRFFKEPAAPYPVPGDLRRKDLEGDLAIEPGIPGSIHFTHAAGTQRSKDLVGSDAMALFHPRNQREGPDWRFQTASMHVMVTQKRSKADEALVAPTGSQNLGLLFSWQLTLRQTPTAGL
jgi:hypothetical protein